MTNKVVGGIIKYKNKYLLVQESKKMCYGKWNIPAGRLYCNETIIECAKREIFEESGYNVNITGIVEIASRISEDNIWLGIIFNTEIIDGNLKYNKDEIIDAKWFSYEEIINMKDNLRSYDWITNAISNVEKNKIASLDLFKIIK